jgi:hypothetical protein
MVVISDPNPQLLPATGHAASASETDLRASQASLALNTNANGAGTNGAHTEIKVVFQVYVHHNCTI